MSHETEHKGQLRKIWHQLDEDEKRLLLYLVYMPAAVSIDTLTFL
jgi:hypothetical protein